MLESNCAKHTLGTLTHLEVIMASEKLETKDLKGWLQRSFTLEHTDLHSVIDSFLDIRVPKTF